MAEINLGILTGLLGAKPPKGQDVQPKELKYTQHPREATTGNAPYFRANPVLGILGAEYFLPVGISYDDSVLTFDQFFIPTAQPVKSTIWLPFPVVSITSRKRIVETYLTQRNGTVKELISGEGYQITVRGQMIGENGVYPEGDMVTLRNLYERNQAVNISCAATDIFLKRTDTKDMVVITSLTIPEKRGNKNVREYEMTMVSDAPFNLYEI